MIIKYKSFEYRENRDEDGVIVGFAQIDDMDEQCGMERVTKASLREKKLEKGEVLMILNEDEDTWEAWNVTEVDDEAVKMIINGGNETSVIENKVIYRMIGRSDDVM